MNRPLPPAMPMPGPGRCVECNLEHEGDCSRWADWVAVAFVMGMFWAGFAAGAFVFGWVVRRG